MKLLSLQISVHPSWHSNAGEYYGEIRFENQSGEIRININEEYSRKILEVTAEQIVETSRRVAQELTTSCIDSVNRIENKALDSIPLP